MKCPSLKCRKSVSFSQLIEHLSNDCYTKRPTGLKKYTMGNVVNWRVLLNSFASSTPFLLADETTGKTFSFTFIFLILKDLYHFFLFAHCTPKESLQFTADIYLDHDSDEPTAFPTGARTSLPLISIDIPLHCARNLALKLPIKEFVRETVGVDRMLCWKVQLVDRSLTTPKSGPLIASLKKN